MVRMKRLFSFREERFFFWFFDGMDFYGQVRSGDVMEQHALLNVRFNPLLYYCDNKLKKYENNLTSFWYS